MIPEGSVRAVSDKKHQLAFYIRELKDKRNSSVTIFWCMLRILQKIREIAARESNKITL